MTRETGKRPWASLSGLLVACTITVIGIVSGLDPDTILYRAIGGGVGFAIVTAIVAGVVNELTLER